MKLQVTYYNDSKELQVEVSNRYVPGVNYDHRFRIAASNTFDEMEAFIYMLSIFSETTPFPERNGCPIIFRDKDRTIINIETHQSTLKR